MAVCESHDTVLDSHWLTSDLCNDVIGGCADVMMSSAVEVDHMTQGVQEMNYVAIFSSNSCVPAGDARYFCQIWTAAKYEWKMAITTHTPSDRLFIITCPKNMLTYPGGLLCCYHSSRVLLFDS